MQTKQNIAFFITPHGLGHAARAAAVMAALRAEDPGLSFELFTSVPVSFFQQSIASGLGYHLFDSDIGLVQKAPLHADIPETVTRLDGFLPFDSDQTGDLADKVKSLECQLVVCDIAPIGITVAREAGIPSLLVENFTWDWIYEDYASHRNLLDDHIVYMKGIFGQADYHIQTEPVSRTANADLTTAPVCRRTRQDPAGVRRALNLPLDRKVVLVTMGGIPDECSFLHRLEEHDTVHFVIPAECRNNEIPANVRFLPHRVGFYHPDLVNACDCVIGKLGYSTVAEVYQAGVPYGYVMRPKFREAGVLATFVEEHMPHARFSPAEFSEGTWLERLDELLNMPRDTSKKKNGDSQIADFIFDLLATA
jgi:hypothetical protein